MTPTDIMTGLLDPSPCFVCEDVAHRESTARYRVPVCYRLIPNFYYELPDVAAGARALAALPDLPSTHQLRALLQHHIGIGLWVSKWFEHAPAEISLEIHDLQASFGSLLIFPPAEWPHIRHEFADWQSDGMEATFGGLPYGFDDIVPFAGPNFSPDRWFLILRGPMAGNVCLWTHEGEGVMDHPWAADIKAWADRLFSETPDVLGGVNQFSARDSIDQAPDDAELFPLEYRRETPTVAD